VRTTVFSRATLRRALLGCAAAAALGGCAHQDAGHVATVDLGRISSNWPKFINYNNQLGSDEQAIESSNAPERVKAQERDRLRARFVQMQNEVAGDVQDAVKQLAAQKGYQLVVTREFVGYGGIDITADVEKMLDITEKPAPK